MEWPKRETYWIEDRTLFISVPFTWRLPAVKERILQRDFEWDTAIIGGPAVKLLPDYFDLIPYVKVLSSHPQALQRVNPMATKTTVGCVNSCKFCAVPKIEGQFVELSDWPDRPIICDNNILAASIAHFDRVCDRLEHHEWADFNQGLDIRLLNRHHAERLHRIKNCMIRLALDHKGMIPLFEQALDTLRAAGIPKTRIRSYALIAFNSDPSEAWERCNWIESHGIKALPMWYHPLDVFAFNTVTADQAQMNWSESERKRILQWFYQHRTLEGRKDHAKRRSLGLW